MPSLQASTRKREASIWLKSRARRQKVCSSSASSGKLSQRWPLKNSPRNAPARVGTGRARQFVVGAEAGRCWLSRTRAAERGAWGPVGARPSAIGPGGFDEVHQDHGTALPSRGQALGGRVCPRFAAGFEWAFQHPSVSVVKPQTAVFDPDHRRPTSARGGDAQDLACRSFCAKRVNGGADAGSGRPPVMTEAIMTTKPATSGRRARHWPAEATSCDDGERHVGAPGELGEIP